MTKRLLMISGKGASDLLQGRQGAFYNTLQEFSKHWQRIDILAPHVPNGNITRVFFGNVFVHASPWPLVWQPWFIFQKGKQLFRQEHFDLMTVHEYPPFYNGLGAWLLQRVTNIPYVLEIHHIPGYPRAATLKEAIYRQLTRWLIRFEASPARAVRVVNQHQAPEFLQAAGVPTEKIRYMPSFYIDQEIFRPMDASKIYDCIFVGRLEKNKGIDLFIDAIKKLAVSAVIIGDGPLKEHVQSRIAREEITSLRFHGWAKDAREIAHLMNQSRILIMPSYNEGGPRVVLEAMACGLAIAATPVGIVPDIIQDGHTGRIIPWQSGAIARIVKEMLDDTAAQHCYGQAGLDIARRFEKHAAIKHYADALYQLIP